ncbi:MAG: hypothetical protein U1E16_08515 [Hyphomicrobiales bacterium]|uniref:hypothetical protein n=1 Tax=Aestuariivirga sp. TaxID=2650926 RepID=UPI0035AE253D
MSGIFIRAISLLGLALLAGAGFSGPGQAGGNHGEPPPVYEQEYSGPPIIRRIPGLRILFGDRTISEDETGQTDGGKKKKKKIDETYYEPQPAQPAKPKVVKPPPPKTATSPASPANPALPQKTAAVTSGKAPGDGPLTCESATQVVAGFGFSSVEASSCSGKIYAFNAKRGGKSFAIKLDPASGELTEVKKLP